MKLVATEVGLVEKELLAGGSSRRRAARGAPSGPFPERSALPLLVEKLLAASRE
jgi:hypothetical protein